MKQYLRKISKNLGQIVPLNSLRVLLLRSAGYDLGKRVWAGKQLLIIDDSSGINTIRIGDRAALAPRVTLVLQSFPNYSMINDVAPTKRGDIIIGDDAWIGTGSIILPGITVGEGSVIGAGSVVTKDVPPRSVVAGSPARIIRYLDEPNAQAEEK